MKDGNYTELIFNVNPYFQLSLLKTFYCFVAVKDGNYIALIVNVNTYFQLSLLKTNY